MFLSCRSSKRGTFLHLLDEHGLCLIGAWQQRVFFLFVEDGGNRCCACATRASYRFAPGATAGPCCGCRCLWFEQSLPVLQRVQMSKLVVLQIQEIVIPDRWGLGPLLRFSGLMLNVRRDAALCFFESAW